MKIFTVIGARPQFIKSAAISRCIKEHFNGKLKEITFHTGQHYDQNMSQVFFEELNLNAPKYQLDIPHDANRMDYMHQKIQEAIRIEKPDVILVYGDTDSTLAGAEVGAKEGLPVVHVEAGLRSYNYTMPEERNRVETDKISTLLFTPTETGLKNLIDEGFPSENQPPYHVQNPKIYHCGDVMYDNSLFFGEVSIKKSNIISDLNLPENFFLITVHRNYNTDNPERLESIFSSFLELANRGHHLLIPLHPRTVKMLDEIDSSVFNQINTHDAIQIISPVSFLDIIALEKNAQLILTDSGGMQKEAFFFQKPCVILREETEWTELVENGNAILCGADRNLILASVNQLLSETNMTFPPFYGDGNAAHFICSEILRQL